MLYVTDRMVQLSGIVLPGEVKKIEITQAATIDEVKNDNNVTLGYQPTGYELAKMSVEITLEPTPDETFEEQLETIQFLFRPVGQTEPKVLELVNSQAAAITLQRFILNRLEVPKRRKAAMEPQHWNFGSMYRCRLQQSRQEERDQDLAVLPRDQRHSRPAQTGSRQATKNI